MCAYSMKRNGHGDCHATESPPSAYGRGRITALTWLFLLSAVYHCVLFLYPTAFEFNGYIRLLKWSGESYKVITFFAESFVALYQFKSVSLQRRLPLLVYNSIIAWPQ